MTCEHVDVALRNVLPTRQRVDGGWLYGAWMQYDFLRVRSRGVSSAERTAAQGSAHSLIQQHRQQLIDTALRHLPSLAQATDCEVRAFGPAEAGRVLVIVEWRADA